MPARLAATMTPAAGSSRSSDQTSALDRFFREDSSAQAALCSCLSPKDLAAMAATNRHIYHEVSAYRRRAFSIDRLLQPYFSSPNDFRALQATTGALISGPAALHFFDRAPPPPTGLDIFVELEHAELVVRFLLAEGYAFRPYPNQEPAPAETVRRMKERIANWDLSDGVLDNVYVGGGLAGVLRFVKGAEGIQIVTARESPLTIILDFHVSCIMNIITHEKAYSLFPLATFENRQALVIKHNHRRELEDAARQKYHDLGWELVERVGGGVCADFHAGDRWIGDAQTWTIRLTPSLPDLPPDCRETSAFELDYSPKRGAKVIHYVFADRALHQSVTWSRDADATALKTSVTTMKQALKSWGAANTRIDELLNQLVQTARQVKRGERLTKTTPGRVPSTVVDLSLFSPFCAKPPF